VEDEEESLEPDWVCVDCGGEGMGFHACMAMHVLYPDGVPEDEE
jgi:hypothetical protein